MKTRNILALGLLVSSVLSCSFELSPVARTTGNHSGNVQISFAPQGQSRTITGTVFPTVGRYELTFQSGSDVVTQTATQPAVSLQLALGSWDVTVEAYDSVSGGDLIAAAAQTIAVVDGSNTFNLTLLPLSNLFGNLDVQYDFTPGEVDAELVFAIRPWALDNLDSDDISTVTVNDFGNGPLPETDTLTAGTWEAFGDDSDRISAAFHATLKSGTYLLQITINNSGTPYQMHQELVRIYDNTDSVGHLNPIWVLHFDPNSVTATGSMDPMAIAEGSTVGLDWFSEGDIVNPEFAFARWNTQPDGNGTDYADGDDYTMGNADTTLYAIWSPLPSRTVSFFANGGTGTVASMVGSEGSVIALPLIGNTMTNPGYSFTGWNTDPTGAGTPYEDGATVSLGKYDVDLYAQWGRISFSVVGFTANGWGEAGAEGSGTDPFFKGGTVGFIGVTAGGGSGYLQTYDTGATPAPGLSGSSTTDQGEFRVSRFTSQPAMTMDAVAIYNATGTTQNIDVRGWAGDPLWPAPTTGEVVYQQVTVAPGWNTVLLSGFVGIDTVTFDFTDYQTFYFNDFAIR